MKNEGEMSFKKVLLICVVMLLLSSCSKENLANPSNTFEQENGVVLDFSYSESDDNVILYNAYNSTNIFQYEDGYIYFNKSGPFGSTSSTLMRYNVSTGNITSICPDPLCKHDSPDCPLYGLIGAFIISKNIIYFNCRYNYLVRKSDGAPDYYKKFCGFVSYDIENNKRTVLEEYEDTIISGRPFDIFIYNYHYYYRNIYDEKSNNYKITICRRNLITNEVIMLDDISLQDVTTIMLFTLNNRIYFSDGCSIFSTNYDGNDYQTLLNGKFDIAYTDGQYIYYRSKLNDTSQFSQSKDVYTVHRVDFNGKNDIDLNLCTKNFAVTGKYIYYIAYDEEIIGKNGIKGRSGENIVLSGSEIRRCNHDGSDNICVFRFDGDMVNYRLSVFPLTVIGNYIYSSYEKWTDINGDGIFVEGELYNSTDRKTYNIMRIDVNSGDVYYIKAPIG
jgi:hypothetical protein